MCKLEAYHASMRDLIVPTKLKPFNASFLRKIFQPDEEYFIEQGDCLELILKNMQSL